VIVQASVEAIERQEPVDLIVWEAAMSHAAVAEIVLPSTVVPEDTADRARDRAAAVAAPVWDRAVPVWDLEAVVAAVPVAGGGGKHESR
jgi:hypothetical protein